MDIEMKKVIDLVKEAKKFVDDRARAEHIKVKGYGNFVTQVDTDIQSFLERELKKLVPEVGFLGEESGLHQMKEESFWILDPIDGTANLVYDYRFSAISLGLYSKGEIILGIIYNPFSEEVFYAKKGEGSFLNGTPIHVSEAERMRETIIAVGTAPYQKELAEENFERFKRIYMNCEDIRRTGSAALDLAYTACGRIGGFFEPVLQPWDFAAGSLIVEEAGGRVTDFSGKPLDLLHPGKLAASNGKIHEELIGLL